MFCDFCKIHIQSIANESIRARLKKTMVQADANNNMNVKNEINYDYTRINNKGIILLPESLRIDTTPKIESLTIKLKNIDAKGIKRIKFSRNGGYYFTLRRQADIQRSKMNASHIPAQNNC